MVPHDTSRAASLALAAGALLAACGTASKSTLDKAAEARAVLAVDRQMQAAFAKKDIDSVVRLFTDEGRAIGPGGPPMVGPAAIRQGFGEMMKDPKLSLTWTPEAPQVSDGGDVAYETGTYRLTMTGPAGEPVQDHGSFVTVFRRVAGAWKYDRDIATSELPPMTAPAPAAGATKS